MATTVSVIARFVSGVAKAIDVSAAGNALWVDSLQVGNSSPTTLTKTILDRLVSLQNGTDVDGTYHTHNTLYFTQTQLGSTEDPSGASLIGVAHEATNYSPASADVEAHLAAIDTALSSAGGDTFSDADFRIQNDTDSTKQIAFSAAGLTTATTRTITMPDTDVDLGDLATALQADGSVALTGNLDAGGQRINNLSDPSGVADAATKGYVDGLDGANLKKDGSVTATGDLNMGTHKITALSDPTAAQDAATKAYVDAVGLGLAPKKAVRTASTANIDISTALVDGSTVDGITLATGDRVLLKDQTDATENGIYVVVASGAASRSTDMDSLTPIDEVNGAWVPVQLGTVNAGRVYVEYSPVSAIGTDPINFEFYNPIAALMGGDMITVSGSTISVDLAANGGLKSTNPGNAAGQLTVSLEASNPSLQVNGSNELGVKLDAAGAITSGADGLKVGVDGSTLEIDTNAVRVKASGITDNELADGAVTAAKLDTSVVGNGLVQEAGTGALGVRGVYLSLTNANAGTLNAGTVVRISANNSFDAADADAASTCQSTIGVLLANTTAGAAGLVQVSGVATPTGGGSFTAGARVYVSGTAGSSTVTAPSASGACVVLLGIAVNATQVALATHFEYEIE